MLRSLFFPFVALSKSRIIKCAQRYLASSRRLACASKFRPFAAIAVFSTTAAANSHFTAASDCNQHLFHTHQTLKKTRNCKIFNCERGGKASRSIDHKIGAVGMRRQKSARKQVASEICALDRLGGGLKDDER